MSSDYFRLIRGRSLAGLDLDLGGFAELWTRKKQANLMEFSENLFKKA